MDTADLIALYAAGLSTCLALSQGVKAWRNRTRVRVAADMIHSSSDSYGTPVRVQRGEDVLDETVSVYFTIRNLGGAPVQILGVVIENLSESKLQSSQITPRDLPVVLEPGTTVEIPLQKEHLDILESCTFLGVVDGAGRRHAVPMRQAKSLIEESWRLPTRVSVYQRRDDPSKRVVAYQLAERGKITQRSAKRGIRRSPHVITNRSGSLMEALLNGDQPRVSYVPVDGEDK